MKKFLVAALLCISSFSAHAGVPTIDATHIASAVMHSLQQYGQSLEEFRKLQQQYQQMQQLEQIATGQRNFLDVLNNPLVMNNIPNDLTTAIANAKNDVHFKVERAKYSVTNNPLLNELYDKVASQEAASKTFFQKMAARLDAQQRQKTLYDAATDPAGRASAANAIAADAEISKADAAVLEAFKAANAKAIEEARVALHKNLMCQEFSNALTIGSCK